MASFVLTTSCFTSFAYFRKATNWTELDLWAWGWDGSGREGGPERCRAWRRVPCCP